MTAALNRAAESRITIMEPKPELQHAVGLARQAATDIWLRKAGTKGATYQQFLILSTVQRLTKAGGIVSQTVLVEATGIDRSTLADVVRRLQLRKCLQRRRTKDDRRAYSVTLTEEGRQQLKRYTPIAKDVEEEFVSGLTASEARTITELLRKLVKNHEENRIGS